MQFLRADAHLGSETEFPSISEASRSVPVHGGRVYLAEEPAGIPLIAGYDGVGMFCRISVDVRYGLIHIRHYCNGHAEPKIFFIPILCFRSGNR